jgi:polyketide synthase PksJ
VLRAIPRLAAELVLKVVRLILIRPETSTLQQLADEAFTCSIECPLSCVPGSDSDSDTASLAELSGLLEKICGVHCEWEGPAEPGPFLTPTGFAPEACHSADQAVVEALGRLIFTHHLLGPIHSIICAQAAQTPTAPAVTLGDLTLTYAELVYRAKALADHLLGNGVARGEFLVVSMPKSELTIVSWLAAWMINCPFTNLDPDASAPMAKYQCGVVQSSTLLCASESDLAKGRSSFDRVFTLGSFVWGAPPVGDVGIYAEQGADMSRVAFVEWTSGSTAEPKAVEVTHASLGHWIGWFHWQLPTTQSDPHVAALNPFLVWSFHVPLSQGGHAVIVPDDVLLDADAFSLYCSQRAVTRLAYFTPSLVETWLEASTPAQLERMATLQWIYFSGEALSVGCAEQCLSRIGHRVQLMNILSCTETAGDICAAIISDAVIAHAGRENLRNAPVGRPMWNNHLVLRPLRDDERHGDVDLVDCGELLIDGMSISREYLGNAELSAKRFDRLRDGRLRYSSRDIGTYRHWADCGPPLLCLLGRLDDMVKVRGFRVELSAIESALAQAPGVKSAAVVVVDGAIATLIVPMNMNEAISIRSIQLFAEERMPEGHVPTIIRFADRLPLLPASGKLARREVRRIIQESLNENSVDATTSEPHILDRANQSSANVVASGEDDAVPLELLSKVRAAWAAVLGRSPMAIGYDVGFFEIGGNSLKAMKLAAALGMKTVKIYQFPTVRSQARSLIDTSAPSPGASQPSIQPAAAHSGRIAIIGMSGRWPGADNLLELWQQLQVGADCTADLSDAKLKEAGVTAEMMRDNAWVKRAAMLNDDLVNSFDHRFFRISHSEAVLTAPEQRILLECAYEALEDSGWTGWAEDGQARNIGVFAAAGSLPHHLTDVLCQDESLNDLRLNDSVRYLQLELANEKDYAAARIAHALDLRGPTRTVATACSSSLAAVADAVDALRANKCNVALAGGASVRVPQETGYRYEPSMIYSDDGRCRPFCANAAGTVEASGASMFVLKRIEDAVRDGDRIYAEIAGIGVNNDGRRKVGLMAPSVEGQREAIRMAMDDAGVQATAMQMVECHGTGTKLGDQVEVEALKLAFENDTNETQFCSIGSIKSNIGHCNTAAGASGLAKLALCIYHGYLVPSVHAEAGPNPQLELDSSPFFLQTELRAWNPPSSLRCGGVSSFGMAGTNVHIICQQHAPKQPSPDSSAPACNGDMRIVALSAMDAHSLQLACSNLQRFLESDQVGPESSRTLLADMEHTLLVRRPHYSHRFATVCHSVSEAIAALAKVGQVADVPLAATQRDVVFLFPGQGSQSIGMGQQLYHSFASYRRWSETCNQILDGALDSLDLETSQGAQLSVFVASYCTAKLLEEEWGIKPTAMLGHSLGEYVAACIAGVFSLHDALCLIKERGRLMDSVGDGAMLAVNADASHLSEQLMRFSDLDIACVNAPSRIVLSGPRASIDAIQLELEHQKLGCRRLHCAVACHSGMLDPVLPEFEARVHQTARGMPIVPIVSAATGTWLSAEEAMNPQYWRNQLRGTVLFSEALQTCAADLTAPIFLEVGPGTALASLARAADMKPTLSAMRHPRDPRSEPKVVLDAIVQLWSAGVDLDWKRLRFLANAQRSFVSLPLYPFHRIDCRPKAQPRRDTVPHMASQHDQSRSQQLLYRVQWCKQQVLPSSVNAHESVWPLLTHSLGICSTALRIPNTKPVHSFEAAIRAALLHKRLLVAALFGEGQQDEQLAAHTGVCALFSELIHKLLRARVSTLRLCIILDSSLQASSLIGFVRTLCLEHREWKITQVVCDQHVSIPAALLAHLDSDAHEPEYRIQTGNLEVPRAQRVHLPASHSRSDLFDSGLSYVITGGMRGIGLLLAEWMARDHGVRSLVLVGRKEPDASALDVIDNLTRMRCDVTILCVDVADSAAFASAVDGVRSKIPPVAGVMHCAGVVDDGAIIHLNASRIRSVLAPKLACAQFHRLFDALQFAVLFSSSAAVFGTVGQATYCAANTLMERIALQRCREGKLTLAIQWGGWRDVGMSVNLKLKPAAGESFLTNQQVRPSSFVALDSIVHLCISCRCRPLTRLKKS